MKKGKEEKKKELLNKNYQLRKKKIKSKNQNLLQKKYHLNLLLLITLMMTLNQL